jgi:hypothetical protein
VVKDDSNTKTSTAPTVEELMKKPEKLNVEVKRLKTKDKKGKIIPPQAKMMTPHLNRKSPTKGRRKGNSEISPLITLCFFKI